MHALIIDDDRYSLSVLNQILSMEGVTSTTVSNSKVLPDLLATLPVLSVIFLDLEMPNMNGYQIFQQLRAEPRFQGVPIVACTVHTSEIGSLRKYGFDSFIGKPIDADAFPAQLRQILGGQAVWQT